MIRKRKLRGLRNLHAFFGTRQAPRTVIDSVFDNAPLIPVQKCPECEGKKVVPCDAIMPGLWKDCPSCTQSPENVESSYA